LRGSWLGLSSAGWSRAEADIRNLHVPTVWPGNEPVVAGALVGCQQTEGAKAIADALRRPHLVIGYVVFGPAGFAISSLTRVRPFLGALIAWRSTGCATRPSSPGHKPVERLPLALDDTRVRPNEMS
jgi:hypothetical protein